MSEQQEVDARLTDLAIRLVLTMMSSADRKKIRPVDWWNRARSALETAASRAERWEHLVSVMADKLQIEVLSAETSSSIYSVGGQLGDDWPRFRELAERDALFIVAMARSQKRGGQ